MTNVIQKVLARARLRAQISRELSDRSGAGPACPADVAGACELIASLVLCSPFLRILDSEQIRQLVRRSWIIRRRRDDLLFVEGDSGSSAFLVLEGAVALEHSATAFRARIEPGRVLSTPASMAWLATARAESEVRALEIPGCVYDGLRAAKADSDARAEALTSPKYPASGANRAIPMYVGRETPGTHSHVSSARGSL